MKIEKNCFVEFHYALLDNNEVIEGSRTEDPLTYVHGHQMLVPGLEAALAGREAGDQFQVEVPPEQGYGDRDDSLTQVLPRESFEGLSGLKEGLLVNLETESGEAQLGRILSFDDEEVQVDLNHPYAGETLHFDVEVVFVRKATDTELSEAKARTSE